jgi:hypothetical protein
MTHAIFGRHIELLLATALLASCAIPATQVMVPTESMRDALQQTHTHRVDSVNDMQQHHPPRSSAPPGAPQPLLTPPDVRMAYLYEWVDGEGNKHFGSWVAIPLAGFDWVMTDGSNPPVAPPTTDAANSQSSR